MLNKLIELVIAAVAFYLIFQFVLPLLSGIIHTIAVIIVAVAAIVWLLRFAGLNV